MGSAGYPLMDERRLLLGLLRNREGALSASLLAAGIDTEALIRQLRQADEG